MNASAASPVGSSNEPHNTCSRQVGSGNSPTTLVAKAGSKRAPYITAGRLAATEKKLTPIDWETIHDIAAMNVLSGNQLRRLHYQDSETGKRMARLNLKRLVELRLIARLGRRVGGERSGSEGFVYALDVAGQRLLGPTGRRPRRPWTPDSHHLAHALAVSELYVRLREAEAKHELTLEQFDTEPRCWRSFHGPGGARLTLKPDAFALTGVGEFIDSWFVELDRATEPLPRITDKCKLYWRYWQSGREQAEHEVFPTVLYVVPTEHRKSQLAALLSRLPAEQRQLFQVTTSDQAVQAMASGELVTTNQEKEVRP